MNRKNFIKKSILGAAGVATGNSLLNAKNVQPKNSTYDRMMEQVGFNHLPEDAGITSKNNKGMKTVVAIN